MCLIAVLYRMFDDAPIVLLANREEEYARGGTTIARQHGPVPYIAGTDPTHGGTWLGINAHRLVVAVTNRPKSNVPEAPRSRGLLVKDLLEHSSAGRAAEMAAKEIASGSYRGCNLLCADSESLWVVHGGDWLRVRSLSPGIHIMTNGDVNDPHDGRIRAIATSLHQDPSHSAADALKQLQRFACVVDGPAPICLRGEHRGTVASTLLSISSQRRRGRLLHADGSPDRCEYKDRTDLLWEMEGLMEDEQWQPSTRSDFADRGKSP